MKRIHDDPQFFTRMSMLFHARRRFGADTGEKIEPSPKCEIWKEHIRRRVFERCPFGWGLVSIRDILRRETHGLA